MPFLLDTNAVIEMLIEPTGRVATHARRRHPSDVAVSSVVLHELYYGAYKSVRRDANLARVEGLRFEVLAFDRDDARAAGAIRAALDGRGQPIGPYDVLIAGQALTRRLTLVTHNVREFRRVRGLRVEDWRAAR